MKIGARIIKTGIAVIIAILICEAFNLPPIFGAVSAVINLQPSVYLSIKTGGNLVLANALGIAVGLMVGFFLGGNAFTIGLATIVVIMLSLRLGLQNGILMAVVAAIVILAVPPEQFVTEALSRAAVIFIGLSVAIVVNIVLWTPHRRRELIEKLRVANQEAVVYFRQAVRDFCELDKEEAPLRHAHEERIEELNQGTRELVEHLRHGRKGHFDWRGRSVAADPWFKAAEELVDYNEALVEKANQIYELLPSRLDRRLKQATPPFSDEFKEILQLLETGCATIDRVNQKLRSLVCDQVPVEPEGISEAYWEKLTDAIEVWRLKLSGNLYLHTLIEVAVVAHEIRWISREGRKILQDYSKALPKKQS